MRAALLLLAALAAAAPAAAQVDLVVACADPTAGLPWTCDAEVVARDAASARVEDCGAAPTSPPGVTAGCGWAAGSAPAARAGTGSCGGAWWFFVDAAAGCSGGASAAGAGAQVDRCAADADLHPALLGAALACAATAPASTAACAAEFDSFLGRIDGEPWSCGATGAGIPVRAWGPVTLGLPACAQAGGVSRCVP